MYFVQEKIYNDYFVEVLLVLSAKRVIRRWRTETRTWLESIWENRWSGIALTGPGTAICVTLVWWIPAPGVSVAVMGVAAALMTARSKATRAEKASWMLIISTLLVTEVLAIRKDRKAHDDQLAAILTEEINARAEAKDKFAGIGNGIEAQSRQGEQQFERTVQQQASQFATTMHGVSETINSQTGGDSFCEYGFTALSDNGVQLIAISEGRYPLYGVGARIVDIRHLDPKLGNFTDSEYAHDIGNIGMRMGGLKTSLAGPQIYIPFKTPGTKQGMNVFFSGRNGMWTQLLRFRKVNGSWAVATIVYGSLDVTHFPHGAVLDRIVQKDFPREDLEAEEWKGVEKLPRMH